MHASEWEARFEERLQAAFDADADYLFPEEPMRPRQLQRQQAHERLMALLHLNESQKEIETALQLISDMLPGRLSAGEWSAALDEFLNCENAFYHFFEKNGDEEVEMAIHQMLAISTETLCHCYELGRHCYASGNFDDARCLFLFLTYLAPYVSEFWISLGLSHHQLGQYREAIDVYTTARQLFVGDPSIPIRSAYSYLALGDKAAAEIQLDEAKMLIEGQPAFEVQWQATYDFLRRRARHDRRG